MKAKKFLSAILAGVMLLMTASFTVFAASELPVAVDGVITLTEDVVLSSTHTISENVVIDLAGHKITSPDLYDTDKIFTPMIKVQNATVTVKDSVGGGEIVPGEKNNISSNNNTVQTIVLVDADFTVDGAKISGQKGVNTRYAGEAIATYSSKLQIVNGAVISGGDAIRLDLTQENYQSLYHPHQGTAGIGILSYGSAITVENSELYGGDGLAEGTTVINRGFSANLASAREAIELRGRNGVASTLVAKNSKIKGGDTTIYETAPAIDAQGSSVVTLDTCTVTGGSSLTSNLNYGNGGSAVYLSGTSTVNVTDSTLVGGSGNSGVKNGALEIGNSSANPTVVAENTVIDGSASYAIGGSGKQGSFTLIDSTIKGTELIESGTISSIMVEGTLTVADDSGDKDLGVDVYTTTGATVNGTATTVTPVVAVASVNGTMFGSLDEALADAEASGATETTIRLLQDVTKTTKFNGKVANLTIDLNGKTLYIAASDNFAKGYLKFMNGTVDITGVVTIGDSIFHMLGGADILFENAKLVGENFVSAFAVINLASVGSDATFTNSTVALKDELSTVGGFVKSGSTVDNIVTFDNTDVTLTNLLKAFVNNDIRIENGSDVTVIGGEYGFNVPKLTVSDSKLYVSGSLEPGIKVGNNPIIISGDSDVYVENIAHREATNTGAIEVKDTASLVAETISSALLTGMTVADTATVVSKADKISVEFVEVEDDTDEYLDNELWNIVLKGANAETINRLNSAELTFALADGEGDMAYEIIESNSQIDINPVNNSKDHYEFHFKGKEGVVDTANEIVIGQVAFEGYGDVDFSVDANGTNVVHATTISDNIVDTFRPGTSTTAKVGILDISAVIDSAIETVKENLEIHIAFPNAVNKNAYTYQDMTVTVENDDLGQLYVVKLGENNAANITATPAEEAAGIACTVDNDGCYVVTFTDILVQHNSYEITVEGAGYRTARYTVRMTEDKTVNFWNNVKDADAYMEVSKSESVAPAKLNYLAGDIVKDNKINVYDLSAVVSYFGEAGLSATKNPEYAKYDLNRDGFIDSKDVAIVLVSWGK